MQNVILYLFIIVFGCSCSIFSKGNKNGCPTNGRNVGAEKLASGDEKALKASRKAKYKGN